MNYLRTSLHYPLVHPWNHYYMHDIAENSKYVPKMERARDKVIEQQAWQRDDHVQQKMSLLKSN